MTEDSKHILAYRPDIDALRAIAVMLVLLFHCQVPFFTGGFIGVDVFFVISGYLITNIIISKLRGGPFSLAGFFASRLRRIFPALFVMVVLVSFFCAFFPIYLDSDFSAFRRAARSAALFYSNIFFYKNTGYFDTSALNQVFLHTWSLSVEAQFYLIYPFLVLFLHKMWKNRVWPLLLGLCVLLFGLSAYAVHIDSKAAFYLLPTRAWELLLGGWLASSSYTPAGQNAKKAFVLAGAGMIIVSAVIFNNVVFPAFPGAWALLPCLGAALYIAGGSGFSRKGLTLSFIKSPLLVYVGLISYSIYLWHWPFLVIYRRSFHNPSFSWAALTVIVALTFLFAHFSWKFVERPARTRLAGWGGRRQAVLLACCLLIALVPTMLVHSPLPFFISSYAREDGQKIRYAPFSRIGASEKAPEYIILGDSHARHLAFLFDTLGKERGISGSYYAFYGHLLNGGRANSAADIKMFDEKLKNAVRKERYKTVFIISRWTAGIKGYLPTEAAAPQLEEIGFVYDDGTRKLMGEQALEASLIDTLTFLRNSGVQNVYLFLPTPECRVEVPQAANVAAIFHNDDDSINARFGVSQKEYAERNAEVFHILRRMAAEFDNVALVDPAGILFNGKGASIVVENGRCLYSDDDHLSRVGVMKLEPLVRRLRPFAP